MQIFSRVFGNLVDALACDATDCTSDDYRLSEELYRHGSRVYPNAQARAEKLCRIFSDILGLPITQSAHAAKNKGDSSILVNVWDRRNVEAVMFAFENEIADADPYLRAAVTAKKAWVQEDVRCVESFSES